MRHPVYRLETEGTGRLVLRATARRSWRLTVVVSRAACVFEQLPCTGVAWHERRSFAKLQVLRFGPYAKTGACAAIRRQHLMLWLWDSDEVDAAITSAGLDPEACRLIAEPLMLPVPVRSGAFELPCQGGIDRLELDRGAIRSSRWQPARADQRPAVPVLLARPWSTNLLQTSWLAGNAESVSPSKLAGVALSLLVVTMASYFAYWAGTYLSLQAQVDALDKRPDREAVNLVALDKLKRSQRDDVAWLGHYRRLSASLRVEALLDALEKPMEAHRLVIKEMEVRNDDLRLTVASVGTDIDLPTVLQALERVPGIDTVQLRQNNDTIQATYTMRIVGFRQSVSPAGAEQ